MQHWPLYLGIIALVVLLWILCRPTSIFQRYTPKGYVVHNDTFERVCFEGRIFRTKWGAIRAYNRIKNTGLGSFARFSVLKVG